MSHNRCTFKPISCGPRSRDVQRRRYGGTVGHEGIFEGLNPEQRRAVEAVRGPVVVLAGAGTGKTTTITRRIANQVASGAFEVGQILAVTFTDKAAGEMRSRLAALGVDGVRARTFHAAALHQLHRFGRDPGQILASKVLMLRHLANSLPPPFRFRPAADLATEIERARNARVSPERYEEWAGERALPVPVDLMAKIYRRYEQRKRERGLVDFEDLLEHAIRAFDDDPEVRERFHAACRAITVDEFQDVNLLQATLLDRWLGGRDDLCVVGDDYQSIYGFTGASPQYLLSLPDRFPHATVVRLERNYRSTPQILEFANRLVPRLGGVEKRLAATLPDGPETEVETLASPDAQIRFVVGRLHALAEANVPWAGMAILFRLNARSKDWEEALTKARIPFDARGAAFLQRPAARRLRQVLAGSVSSALGFEVRQATQREGLLDRIPEGLGEAEQTRQLDLARLVALADELEDGNRTVADFLEELAKRFGEGRSSGVNLLTYHRAKGLEFDAVFLPRLEEGDLPVKQARSPVALAEERRLLYVGLTRARRHLVLSWSAKGKPSRFLAELGIERPARPPVEAEDPTYAALKRWRLARATADELPAYVVFHNSTLEEIVRRGPRTIGELASIPGVGPTKLERYGEDLLAALADAG